MIDMQYGVMLQDFRGVAKVECAQAPLTYKGYEVRMSPLIEELTVQKVKTWKHRSLKRPVTKRVYTYLRHKCVLIGNILFVSETIYKQLLKQAS